MGSEAAKISLKAIGKQDTHLLSKDLENSFFKNSHEPHSPFYIKQRVKTIRNVENETNWPWGKKIKVQYDPKLMGDLLSNMAITIPLPAFPSNPPGILDRYAPMIGYHLIKSVTMYVDEIMVEKIDSDSNMVYHNIYQDVDEEQMSETNLNRGWSHRLWSSNSAFQEIHKRMIPITLPLHFFFGRRYESGVSEKPYFPLCSIYNQKIEFEFEFHKKTFFTPTTSDIKLEYFNLITDEIKLTDEERLFFVKTPQVITTEFMNKHPVYENKQGTYEIVANLVPKIPVKSIHWFIRNSDFEKEDNPLDTVFGSEVNSLSNGTNNQPFANYSNRFNFSSALPTGQLVDDIYSEYDNVVNIEMYINGEQVVKTLESGPKYFRFYTCSKNTLSLPRQHHIYTYTFALNPRDPAPSGYFDFENTNSDKTFIRVNIKDSIESPPRNGVWKMHIYYTGYKTMKFEDGFMRFA
jgi:hypothetical protein